MYYDVRLCKNSVSLSTIHKKDVIFLDVVFLHLFHKEFCACLPALLIHILIDWYYTIQYHKLFLCRSSLVTDYMRFGSFLLDSFFSANNGARGVDRERSHPKY